MLVPTLAVISVRHKKGAMTEIIAPYRFYIVNLRFIRLLALPPPLLSVYFL